MQQLHVHLVDDAGFPLDDRYEQVVSRHSKLLISAFPRESDPAEIQNAVEECACRVARWEQRHGRVDELAPFFLRTFSNLVKSLFRRRLIHQEWAVATSDLERLASPTQGFAGRNAIEIVLTMRQVLESLDEGKRRIMILHSEGFTAKEIAALQGVSPRNVNACLYRARAKARQLMATRGCEFSASGCGGLGTPALGVGRSQAAPARARGGPNRGEMDDNGLHSNGAG